MKITYINRTGKTHEIDGTPCEDSIYINENPLVCCVADGVSNSKYGGAGAAALTAEIGERLKDENFRRFVTDSRPGDVSAAIYEIINGCISKLCRKYSGQPDEFASTLLAVISDGTTVTIIHAGDGAVFGKPRTAGGSVMVLSYPDNNEYGSVYHAGHPDTPVRMRVIHLKEEELSSVLLGTDGFTDAYLDSSYQAFDAPGLGNALKCRTNRELDRIVQTKHLGERRITDDISCIIVNFENKPDEGSQSEPIEVYTQYVQKAPVIPKRSQIQPPRREAVDINKLSISEKYAEDMENYERSQRRQREYDASLTEPDVKHQRSEEKGVHVRRKKNIVPYIITVLIIILLLGAVLLSLYNIYMANRYSDSFGESSSKLESMLEAANGRIDELESEFYAAYETESDTSDETANGENETDEKTEQETDGGEDTSETAAF